jgi:hypothetical protein
MKAFLRLMVWFGMTMSFLSFGWDVPLTRADDDSDKVNDKVKWEQIVGILSPGANVGGFIGAGGPWTAQRGRAVVDLSSGKTKFRVNGLVLAFQPRPLTGTPIIGTTGLVTQVKGTLVCDAFASLAPTPSSFVDTPAVPISAQGNAEFEGVVSIPDACLETPQRLAFLIRVANPGTPISEVWIAHGAVRQP